MIELKLPITEETARSLRIGDSVKINGRMFTARDAAHKYFVEKKPEEFKELLRGSFIYHCGPIVKKENGVWRFVSAGPTTSIREEPYEGEVMELYGVRGVIGKGGMGEKTLTALQKIGAVYLHAVGGAGAAIARSIVKVNGVYMLEEFGVPEAIWDIEVEGFPAVVTMDSHGGSLHKKILRESEKMYLSLLK